MQREASEGDDVSRNPVTHQSWSQPPCLHFKATSQPPHTYSGSSGSHYSDFSMAELVSPSEPCITTGTLTPPSRTSPGAQVCWRVVPGGNILSPTLGRRRGCNLSSLVMVLPSVLINAVAVSSIALGAERPESEERGAIAGSAGWQGRRTPLLVSLQSWVFFLGLRVQINFHFKPKVCTAPVRAANAPGL